MMKTDTHAPADAGSGRAIAMAAILIMVGNLLSRVAGLLRESAISSRFDEVDVSLFGALSAVPTQLYDFLVGGLVSAALVPVLSDYLEADDRPALWSLLNTVLTLVVGALGTLAALLWLAAPAVTRLLATDLVTDATQAMATEMLRLMVVAVVLMGMSGLLTGLLQAQRRFLLPAFTTVTFNLGMILAVLFVPGAATVLAWGMLAGAAAQVALQLPGLRGVRIRPRLDLRHPGVRRIGILYAPVALGISFSLIGTLIDRRLASSDVVDPGAIAYMRWATTLIQFALGMVSAAISLAILPTLSRLSTAGDEPGFRRVFGTGLQTVLLLVTPVMVMFALQGEPIIRLMFERNAFSAADTRMTTLALLAYLPSVLAAAIDQPLIFAFYARKQTLLPNLVQGVAVAAYCVVAFASYRAWGMYGLIAANVVQWVVHAVVMAYLAQSRMRAFDGQRFGPAIAKIAGAALLMTAAGLGLRELLPSPENAALSLLSLLVVGGVSALIYLAVLWRLRLDALVFFQSMLMRRLRRNKA